MKFRCIFCLCLFLFAETASSNPVPIVVTPASYLRTCASLFRRTFIPTFRSRESKYQTARVSWLSAVLDLGGVFYLSKKQQTEHEIAFDPANGVWKFVKSGIVPANQKHEFVMLADGRIIFGDYHHSALAAGMDIAAGGHLEFNEFGKLHYLSTSTGHYWESFPNSDLNWQQFIKECLARKANPAGITVYREQAPDLLDFIELTPEDLVEIEKGSWTKPHKPMNPKP